MAGHFLSLTCSTGLRTSLLGVASVTLPKHSLLPIPVLHWLLQEVRLWAKCLSKRRPVALSLAWSSGVLPVPLLGGPRISTASQKFWCGF